MKKTGNLTGLQVYNATFKVTLPGVAAYSWSFSSPLCLVVLSDIIAHHHWLQYHDTGDLELQHCIPKLSKHSIDDELTRRKRTF